MPTALPQIALAPAPDAPGLAPAQAFGKYRILHHLERGAMADLYLAEVDDPPGVRRTVVVKCVLDDETAEPDYVQRFLREASVAATLEHVHVARVLDAGLLDGKYFVATEYLIGEQLGVLQDVAASRGRPVPLEHALGIGMAIASGLHYAHERTDENGEPLFIVHRGVCPDSVLVTYEGGVKLLDFGFARSTSPDAATALGRTDVPGKPTYLSPEQCLGQSLDRRSDIFSLGVILYELTVGARLFRRASEMATRREIVEGRILLPSEVNPAYPSRLEKIVMRALDRDPLGRHASARELQLELEGFAREASCDVTAPSLSKYMETVFARDAKAWRRTTRETKMRPLRPSIVMMDRVRAPAPPIEEWPGLPANLDVARRRQLALQFLADRARPIAAIGLATLALVAAMGWYLGRTSVLPAAMAATTATPLDGVSAPRPAPRSNAMPSVPSPTIAHPQEPAPHLVGTIVLVTSPHGARATIDGVALTAATPLRMVGVEAEHEHVVVVSRDGYEEQTLHITVKPSEELPIQIRLHHAHHSPSSHVSSSGSSSKRHSSSHHSSSHHGSHRKA